MNAIAGPSPLPCMKSLYPWMFPPKAAIPTTAEREETHPEENCGSFECVSRGDATAGPNEADTNCQRCNDPLQLGHIS